MPETKVLLLVSMSGRRNGKHWPDKGETMMLPSDEAEQYVTQGLCRKLEQATSRPAGEKRTSKKASTK